MDLNVKLADNFYLYEFVRSNTADRLGINNIPNEEQLTSLFLLAQNVLQPIRNQFGRITILSGFRCRELNIAVKGAPNSDHLRGEAADIEPYDPNITLAEIAAWAYDNLEFGKLILEKPPTGWIHISYVPDNNIKHLMYFDGSTYYNITREDIDRFA